MACTVPVDAWQLFVHQTGKSNPKNRNLNVKLIYYAGLINVFFV